VKVLVLGNSHVACLRMANQNRYQGNTHYEFIARGQGRGGLNGVEIRDGKLFHARPKQFNGWYADELSTFDAFVFTGSATPQQPNQAYSSALLRTWKTDLLTQHDALRLSSELVRQLNKPCIILPRPFPKAGQTEAMSYSSHKADTQWANDWIGEGISYASLPEETVVDRKAQTDPKYLLEDGSHGNELFGATCLNEVDKILKDPQAATRAKNRLGR